MTLDTVVAGSAPKHHLPHLTARTPLRRESLATWVLSQSKGTGLSNVFGAQAGVYRTKRGFEKVLHYLTIFMAVLFFTVPVLIILMS